MSEWVNAQWTQARQIVALSDPRAAQEMDPEITPDQYFANLFAKGAHEPAVTFLGLALSRLDGVTWAYDAVMAGPATDDPGAAAVRAAVGTWLRDPSDDQRRRINELADDAPDWSPERMLAHAVFLSGGSIAPPDLPAVNPDPDLCGRLTAATVVTVAHMTAEPEEALIRALGAGEAIARNHRR